MGMPYGLKKATAYYIKLEAWSAFRTALSAAKRAGLFDKAIALHPSDNASVTTIYRATEKVMNLLHTEITPGSSSSFPG